MNQISFALCTNSNEKIDSLKMLKTCTDSLICVQDKDGYDFRSQSLFTPLSQGDSLSLTFIAYSKQDFKVFVCGEPVLGKVSFKVIDPLRETVSKVKKINENEEIIFKLDEYGEQILGSDDKPVILSKEVLRDTIWDKNVIIHETLLFDSENSQGNKYWEIKKQEKTRRILVKVLTSGNDKTAIGCLSIFIGRKYSDPFKISGKN